MSINNFLYKLLVKLFPKTQHEIVSLTFEGERMLDYINQLDDPNHYIIMGFDEVIDEIARREDLDRDTAIEYIKFVLSPLDKRGETK